jgi:hypothetical protein
VILEDVIETGMGRSPPLSGTLVGARPLVRRLNAVHKCLVGGRWRAPALRRGNAFRVNICETAQKPAHRQVIFEKRLTKEKNLL